jgi:hypothetical protein
MMQQRENNEKFLAIAILNGKRGGKLEEFCY